MMDWKQLISNRRLGRNIAIPCAMTTDRSSNATAIGSSIRLPSAACKTRRRSFRYPEAYSCTTGSPTLWKFPHSASRWATTWPSVLSKNIRSSVEPSLRRWEPLFKPPGWHTTWETHHSGTPEKKPSKPISRRTKALFSNIR